MTTSTLRIVAILTPLLAVAGYFVFLILGFATDNKRHPTDAALMNEFAKDRVLYDSLFRMADRDRHLWRVSNDFYRLQSGENRYEPSDALSADRWNTYRSLFRRLNLDAGISPSVNSIEFVRSATGLSVSGSSKGFMRFSGARPATHLCNSLDSGFVHVGRPGDGICYRHLDGDWYLYIDWT